ncbi:hypothetical protein BH11BAC5_BH11BAC5_15220 [soil metagenome]
MNLPSNFSDNSKNILTGLSFTLTDSIDNGMGKYYEWSNETMQFLLLYDRGYYECQVLSYQKPINPMDVLRLLRFLKNDETLYKQELIAADLRFTLTTNDYVALFAKNYNLIGGFLKDFSQDKYDNYNKFEYRYEGL